VRGARRPPGRGSRRHARPDRATERLALPISRTITAEPVVYDRLAREVATNILTGDGPTLCVEPGADVWTTYFIDAGGGSPDGCTTLRLVVFTSTAAGVITRVGEADPEHGGDARLL
jgi:hypothetical protein